MQFDFDGPAKVIKGEIHNILSILRSDPRYVSPLRFTQEISGHKFNSYDDGTHYQYQHPLLKSLRDLSDKLSYLQYFNHHEKRTQDKEEKATNDSNSHNNSSFAMIDSGIDIDVDVVTYVSPFVTAIISRELSGPITGAALSSLHKFLLYGFISLDSPRAKDGITLIARCIRHCSFEESKNNSSEKRIHEHKHSRHFGLSKSSSSSANEGKFIFFPSLRRGKRRLSSNNGRSGSGNQHSSSAAMNMHDEEVVMKLLSLSALVIRCEAGSMLNPNDIVGIFETCLHVSCHAKNASTLLRSAAGDTLKHIVLVVFGRGGMTIHSSYHSNRYWNETGKGRICFTSGDYSDSGNDDERLSDDLWAEAKFEEDDISFLNTYQSHYDPINKSANSNNIQSMNQIMNTSVSSQTHSNSEQMTKICAEQNKFNAGFEHNDLGSKQKCNNEIDMNDQIQQENDSKDRDPVSSQYPLPKSDSKESLYNLSTSNQKALSQQGDEINILQQQREGKRENEKNIKPNIDHQQQIYSNSEKHGKADLEIENQMKVNSPMPEESNVIGQKEEIRTTFEDMRIDLNSGPPSSFPYSPTSAITKVSNVQESGHSQRPPSLPSNTEVNPHSVMNSNSPAIVTILHRLAQLSDPRENTDATCIQSLTLINIALETGVITQLFIKYPVLLSILQNDLCRHLLHLSTHFDLVILSLTLRVIFNLFNSIKNHLKVQLEVFLTSVHLRIVNGDSSSPEQKELALESLLEFCHEPALMNDLYMNYDCDMQCTNLFETICKALANHASPKTVKSNEKSDDNINDDLVSTVPLNGLNRLALEGILAVIDSIEQRCHAPFNFCDEDKRLPKASVATFSRSTSDVNSTTDTSQQQDYYEHRLHLANLRPSSITSFSSPASTTTASSVDTNNDWMSQAREKTANVLIERKKLKHRRSLVVDEFNKNATGKEWIPYAKSLGVLPEPANAESVASFLYETPNLDKAGIGLYISKGPDEKYPFHAEVRKHFTSLFTFKQMEFSDALRTFLRKFRLPGEAQCIDRLLELFGLTFFNQQDSKNTIFKNSDAAFILAFSTIMLNTDLHNPNLRDDRRMTVEQFINTNRGLNAGENFQEEFLRDLYMKIKAEEIQVNQDLNEVNDANIIKLDGLLSTSTQVSAPFFTPSETARKTFFQAGVHERDMFTTIFSSAFECITSVYVRSWDDILVVKALRGLQQMAAICAYFQMDEEFNEILRILLLYGKDYISSCIELLDEGLDKELEEASTSSPFLQIAPRHYYFDPEDHGTIDNADFYDEDSPIPFSLIKATSLKNDSSATKNNSHIISNSQLYDDIVDGSASHRGLLSLHFAFTLVCTHTLLVREAWPNIVECLFLLRDANALPSGIGDLDDFADCHGNLLPQSHYALRTQQRVNDFFFGIENTQDRNDGLWGSVTSIFGTSKDEKGELNSKSRSVPLNTVNRSQQFYSEGLVIVSQAAQFEHVFMRSKDLLLATKIIRNLLDARDLGDPNVVNQDKFHPLFEHHAVFALELATRTLLWNRRLATDLFPIFRSKLELMLSHANKENNADEGSSEQISFLIERGVVTILRAFIHLYDIPEVR